MEEETTLINYKQIENDLEENPSKDTVYMDGYKLVQTDEIVKNYVPRKDRGFERRVIHESSLPVLKFITDHLNTQKVNKVILTSSGTMVTKKLLTPLKTLIQSNNIRAIIDFKLTNQKRFINKYFEAINWLLPDAGIYIGRVETNRQRNIRLYGDKKNFFIKSWILFEFMFHRVLPKINSLKALYFTLTKGKYRFLSTAETLGRLVSCGFEIIEYKIIENFTYFVVMKTREPSFNMSPTYGPLVKLNRVGKDGKIIKVYKFRTMHPYSEYIQDFVLKLNGYNAVGKPDNDFRLTPWGKIFRKYWLDEIPQLINVFKGEMKIVGVRPLSRVRFAEFPEDMQKRRINSKPGCIPPYVALNMPSDKGNIEAERIYLDEREKHGISTDISYILKALANIFTKKITSS